MGAEVLAAFGPHSAVVARYPQPVIDAIVDARERAQLERWELAQQIGVDEETIARLERGERRTHKRTLIKILDTLKVPREILAASVSQLTDSLAPQRGDDVQHADRGHAPQLPRGSSVSPDVFAGLRWEWEQLPADQQLEAWHAMQDALRLFTRGDTHQGPRVAKKR